MKGTEWELQAMPMMAPVVSKIPLIPANVCPFLCSPQAPLGDILFPLYPPTALQELLWSPSKYYITWTAEIAQANTGELGFHIRINISVSDLFKLEGDKCLEVTVQLYLS